MVMRLNSFNDEKSKVDSGQHRRLVERSVPKVSTAGVFSSLRFRPHPRPLLRQALEDNSKGEGGRRSGWKKELTNKFEYEIKPAV